MWCFKEENLKCCLASKHSLLVRVWEQRSTLYLIHLDSLEKMEAKEAKSVVNKRLSRLQFCLFI